MKNTVMLLTVCLFSMTAFAANNNFSPASGDWNVAGNWSLGEIPNAGDYGNPVVINSSRICTIQPSTDAHIYRALLGASAPGTLIIKGSLDYTWNNGIQLGVWNAGNGILKILGGTLIGSGDTKREIYVGSTDDDHGTLQIGDGTLGGTGTFSTVYVNSDTNGTSLVDLQSGTLNANIVRLGDTQGTVDTVKMKIGGTAVAQLTQLLVGVSASATSANLEINGGNATIYMSSYFTFAAQSEIDLNFDSAGISTVNGSMFYYGNSSVAVNIAATEDVPAGTYEMFVGRDGGSGHGIDKVNFTINTNSFGSGKVLELLSDTTDGREAFLLQVTDTVAPELGDIDISVSGTNAVISFDGASGFSYALQKKTDLASDSWSNIVSGIAGAGGIQSVSNGMSGIASFYRVISE